MRTFSPDLPKLVPSFGSRCGPWLAKLSKLLEDELKESKDLPLASFVGGMHAMMLKDEASYQIGIAVAADEKNENT